MKTKIAVLICVFLCAAGLSLAANDPKEEKAIMETMDAMRKATIGQDIAMLAKVYHPDLTYTHSGGRTQGKAEVLATVKEGKQRWEAIAYSNATLRIHGSTALFKAICDIRSGPPGKMSAKHSDILWVLLKGPERWQIVARQSTAITSAETNDSKEEKVVIATMESLKEAILGKDIPTLERLYHDDLTFGHSSGRTQTKAEVLEVFKQNKETWESINFSNSTIRIYGSVALFKGTYDVRSGTPGKMAPHHLDLLWILVKGPQGWQIVARQATALPLPKE